MKENSLIWLLKWFERQCDGDWEHGNGISIVTLDNPGWHVVIDITETELEFKDFKKIVVERTENDWYRCFVREGKFEGACGPLNLLEILNVFQIWAEQEGTKK